MLLGKHSGQEEVVVGIPYANRDHPATQDVVGYFVNTLAVRVTVGGTGLSFCDVVKQCHRGVMQGTMHAVVPFVKVVEAVVEERDTSRTPVFQTMLTWEEARGWGETGVGFAGVEQVSMAEDIATSKFEIELSLGASEGDASLSGIIEFNIDLYDVATIERLSARFSVLVSRAVEAPDMAVWEVSLMDGDEKELVVQMWNETHQPYPESSTAPRLFEAQAACMPDGLALMFEGEELSYGELLRQTSGLAVGLRCSGASADSVVGLCVEKSIEEVAGMVGIMRAGAAYVPLDPKLPVDRLQYLVTQCECVSVVSQQKFGAVAVSLGVDVVIAEEALLSGDGGNGIGESGCDSRALAYVLFTSGSTGKPKGVMVEHGSLTAFLCHQSSDGPYGWLVDGRSDVRLYV